ncbi:alpha/beta hydrolase [Saccharomonospora marina]|uniref:alpha/beta hydrolase n=1 Tax=Saccharomonospora marina TaxID=632569 RepID=UPI0003170E0F|nr:alpha/beta hydrolase [Saccharomonospora marina]
MKAAPFRLLGVSLGGLVAQHIAAPGGGLVDWVGFIDTVACYPDELRRMWRDRSAAVLEAGPGHYVEATLNTWFTDAFRGSLRGTIAADHVRTSLTAMKPSAYRTACQVLEQAHETRRLSSIGVPTLVVYGEQDAVAFHDAVHTFE